MEVEKCLYFYFLNIVVITRIFTLKSFKLNKTFKKCHKEKKCACLKSEKRRESVAWLCPQMRKDTVWVARVSAEKGKSRLVTEGVPSQKRGCEG